MPSGGYRKPSRPAPVSGPGALSGRTDSGPAQPVQTATGLPYGQAGQLQQGQQIQPLPNAPSGAPGAQAAGAGVSGPGPNLGGNIFGRPTDAPGEPITAGALTGPGPGPSNYFGDDPDELLRVIYTKFPNDDLRALIEGRELA